MALEKVGVNNVYNDLSPELRKKLDEKILGFGRKVRYKFDISNSDPNPEQKGQIVWPFLWTLDPITFTITDTLEKRPGVQRVKRIGIVEMIGDKGEPNRFRRIRVAEGDKGVLSFDLEKIEDLESVWYLEMHPKLSNGEFSDKTKMQLISRVDEQAAALTARSERTARKKAMDVAEQMSDKEIIDFADAMSGGNNTEWDSTENPEILRNKIEKLAETDPKFFNDLVESKSIKYQAVIKQAMTKGIISFDPAEYKFTWTTNSQPIAVLQPVGNKNEVEKLAEVFMTGGIKQTELYNKIKSLVGGKEVAQV